MQPLRFILQAIDDEFGHPAFETMLAVERPDELRAILGIDAKDDPDFEAFYWLEPHEVAALNRHFGLGFVPEGRATTLSRWTHQRASPYLVHTGYELVLMVDGRKPFARMGRELYPPYRHYDEDRFDRYVALGILHKDEELEKFPEPVRLRDGKTAEGTRTVYYTRKGEEWRISAYKLISKAAARSGWNEQFEHMEGMLLGYQDWQNDWWLENIRRRGIRFGALSLCLAVTEAELTAIDHAGYRALPLRTKPLTLLSAMWEQPDDDAVRELLEPGMAAVVRFSVRAGRFLESLAADRHARVHALPSERVRDLNRLIVSDIEVVLRQEAVAP